MPAPNTRKATRSDQAGPISDSSPASAAPSVPATMPASEMRALTATRVPPSGSSRGTVADLVTPYALDATRQANAAG